MTSYERRRKQAAIKSRGGLDNSEDESHELQAGQLRPEKGEAVAGQ